MTFQKIREVDLKLKLSKCAFFKRHLQYLGHLISGQGIFIEIKSGNNTLFGMSKDVNKIGHIIGLASYYRKYFTNFRHLVKPLTELTKKNTTFNWNLLYQQCLDAIKAMMTNSSILIFLDPNKPYTYLQTLLSTVGLKYSLRNAL